MADASAASVAANANNAPSAESIRTRSDMAGLKGNTLIHPFDMFRSVNTAKANNSNVVPALMQTEAKELLVRTLLLRQLGHVDASRDSRSLSRRETSLRRFS